MSTLGIKGTSTLKEGLKMIKETLLLTAVHAFLPQTFDFVKAYGAYERELNRTKRRIERIGDIDLLVSGKKDETDYNSALKEKADRAAKTVFALNRLCRDTYGCGFIDCDHPIVDIREKQDLVCEVDSVLRNINPTSKKVAK